MIQHRRVASSLVLALCSSAFLSSARAATWESAAPMNVTREYPGLALMPDGHVLAVTGHPLGGKSLASAEIYDPDRNVWKPTGSLNVARNGVESGGVLSLPNGLFLITGGGTANRSVHEAELFDYKTETWTTTGSMHTPRCVHSATQLASGDVLVIGGIDWLTEDVHASAEIYDYKAGTWKNAGSMARSRFSHRAVRLLDGRILVTGGNSAYPNENVVSSAEIYDPATDLWRETTPMQAARRGHVATLLPDGRVLVAGGSSGHFQANVQLSTAEVFDPTTEKWTAVAPLREARWGATETLLPNGEVLIVGGAIAPHGARSSAELFNPEQGTWVDAGRLKQARNGHRAITLKDGRVLIVGGFYVVRYLATCELYVP
jgi:N-acetylneuraminic acid mutarotase